MLGTELRFSHLYCYVLQTPSPPPPQTLLKQHIYKHAKQSGEHRSLKRNFDRSRTKEESKNGWQRGERIKGRIIKSNARPDSGHREHRQKDTAETGRWNVSSAGAKNMNSPRVQMKDGTWHRRWRSGEGGTDSLLTSCHFFSLPGCKREHLSLFCREGEEHRLCWQDSIPIPVWLATGYTALASHLRD